MKPKNGGESFVEHADWTALKCAKQAANEDYKSRSGGRYVPHIEACFTHCWRSHILAFFDFNW
jgi:hypothetical protein